jgi:hypothetical protein
LLYNGKNFSESIEQVRVLKGLKSRKQAAPIAEGE